MLEQEFQYYKEHQDELVSQYNEKYIVIVGKEVIRAFDSEIEAYEWAKEEYGLGSFLLQHCLPGSDSYTQTFHSRVVFQ